MGLNRELGNFPSMERSSNKNRRRCVNRHVDAVWLAITEAGGGNFLCPECQE